MRKAIITRSAVFAAFAVFASFGASSANVSANATSVPSQETRRAISINWNVDDARLFVVAPNRSAQNAADELVVLTRHNPPQQSGRQLGRVRIVSGERRDARNSARNNMNMLDPFSVLPQLSPFASPFGAPNQPNPEPRRQSLAANSEPLKPISAPTAAPIAQDANAETIAPETPIPQATEDAQNANVEETAQIPQSAEEVAAENKKREAAANAQAAENSAEEKTRALETGDSDAPDARVNLPKVDATTEKPDAPPVDDNKTTTQPVVKTRLGYPDAQKAVQDMSNDLLTTLNSRGGTALYDRWRAYNAGVRRQTSALESGSELNGRCRLRWYERLYSDPLRSVGEVEHYSRAWGSFFTGSANDVVSGVRLARERMDVQVRGDRPARNAATTPDEALQILRTALVDAAAARARALAPMTKDDVASVAKEAHSIFCGQVQSGHTVPSRGRAKYLIDAMQKMNKGALYDSAESILSVLDSATLEQLAKLDVNSFEKVLVDGQEVGRVATEVGDILIGGSGRNVWNLDKYGKVCCVVDLGGDDVYNEGACNINRPLLVVIDLGQGQDEYVGKGPGIQGGAILGVSVWYDGGGNDRYLAKDVAQGSAIGGVGVLINEGGDDRYLGFLRAQGAALCGLGLHIDRGGNDDYRGALFAQGFGAPGGFGALVDKDGADHYYVGGYYFDSYPEHPGYDGWGQGVGAGIRRVACGGIGLLIDGGGDDAYEYDYFGHGGGYWMGVGIARDFGGDDIRYAATSTMYDGSRRREARWQRFGAGFGCHYAVGYLFDDEGNDSYNGTIMGVGMGWDLGAGFLVDFDGNDAFEATGGLTQGAGGEGSIGAIMKYRGDDIYRGNYQGYATSRLTYHAPQDCGANYSFVIDHGGNDQYGSRAQNNAVTARGTATGFIVDRPAPGEQAAKPAQTDARPSTAQGYPTQNGAIQTMVGAPPTVDPTPRDLGRQPQGNFGGFGGRGPWRLFGGGM